METRLEEMILAELRTVSAKLDELRNGISDLNSRIAVLEAYREIADKETNRVTNLEDRVAELEKVAARATMVGGLAGILVGASASVLTHWFLK